MEPVITTRVVRRFKGYTRRAVYLNGRHVGYIVGHLRLYTAFHADGEMVQPEGTDIGWELLREAVGGLVRAVQAAASA